MFRVHPSNSRVRRKPVVVRVCIYATQQCRNMLSQNTAVMSVGFLFPRIIGNGYMRGMQVQRMVLVYRVDVRSLPAVHQQAIMRLVNACYNEPITSLAVSYGVVYQSKGCVLGVALVDESAERHLVTHMCVHREHRHRGIATDLVELLKEQLVDVPLCVYKARDWSTADSRFFERRGFHEEDDFMMYREVR